MGKKLRKSKRRGIQDAVARMKSTTSAEPTASTGAVGKAIAYSDEPTASIGSVGPAVQVDSLPMTADERRAKLEADGVLISNTGRKFDDINAEIRRRDWNQFEQNDMPYMLNYADAITSGVHQQRAVDQAVNGVNKGFELAAQNQQMRDAGLGVGLSDAMKADRASDIQRNKTASLVDAENNARLAGKDRENALLAGSHMPRNN